MRHQEGQIDEREFPSVTKSDAAATTEQSRDERLSEIVSTHPDCRELLSAVCHDLRGPLVNLSGFSSELDTDAAEIETLLRNSGDQIPADLRAALERCVKDNLRGTLAFITSSAEQAMQRLKKFDKLKSDNLD